MNLNFSDNHLLDDLVDLKKWTGTQLVPAHLLINADGWLYSIREALRGAKKSTRLVSSRLLIVWKPIFK